MGFFFRKRIKLFDGVSLNLSKSGVGFSYGVKGFRIAHRPDGHSQLNAGRYGLYYRKSLSHKKKDSNDNVQTDISMNDIKLLYKLALYPFGFVLLYLLFCAIASYSQTKVIIGCIIAYFIGLLITPVIIALTMADDDEGSSDLDDFYMSYLHKLNDIKGDYTHFIFPDDEYNIMPRKDLKFEVDEEKIVELKNIIDKMGDSFILHAPVSHSELQYGLLDSNLFGCTVPFVNLCDRKYKLCFLDNSIVLYNNENIYQIPYCKLSIYFNKTSALMLKPPEYANIVSTTYEHVNKDGSPNKRYKDNEIVYEINAYVITIKDEPENVVIPLAFFDEKSTTELYNSLLKLMEDSIERETQKFN